MWPISTPLMQMDMVAAAVRHRTVRRKEMVRVLRREIMLCMFMLSMATSLFMHLIIEDKKWLVQTFLPPYLSKCTKKK